VRVEPGDTLEVRPREPTPTVGAATPSIEQMEREMRELRKRLHDAEQALAAQEEAAPAVKAPPTVVPPRPEPTPPPAGRCDADALAEKGRDAFAAGQLAASLKHFDQAYACRPALHHAEKAFLAACNMPSVPQAQRQWARLTPASRQRILAVCVRNGITEDVLDQANAPRATLQISSRPPAKVSVDGREIGMAPVELEVSPGRHRVLLQHGADRYTFTVTAKAGATVTLDKVLTNP
jgi:hypothetical protein